MRLSFQSISIATLLCSRSQFLFSIFKGFPNRARSPNRGVLQNGKNDKKIRKNRSTKEKILNKTQVWSVNCNTVVIITKRNMQSQKIAKPLCYTCRTQEMWKRIAIKMCLWQVASSTPFEHKIMQHMHVLKHRKMKILHNSIFFLFIDVIVQGHVIIANHASFLSRIAAVVTRTGCTAVVNECKKLSVLGELLHG